MSAGLTPWIVFLVAVAALLAIDLGVSRRRGDVMSTVIVIAVGGSIVASLWLTRSRELPTLPGVARLREKAEEA